MSRPAPRRPSRTTTPRPRKIAGRDVAPAEETGASASSGATTPAAPAAPSAPARPAAPPPPPQPPRTPPVAKAADDGDTSRLGSVRTTVVLLGLVATCVLLLVLQGIWFFVHADRNDDGVAATSSEKADDDAPIPVPSGRPVILNEAAVQEGVDAAASAAQLMFARSYKNYDDGVADALKLMTDRFAEEYKATTDDVRDEFIKKKTQVEVRVVAQSVVRANATELEALIFLNQYVIRGQGAEAKTTYTPYRALLTMVHTDTGWLVDDLDTK